MNGLIRDTVNYFQHWSNQFSKTGRTSVMKLMNSFSTQFLNSLQQTNSAVLKLINSVQETSSAELVLALYLPVGWLLVKGHCNPT